MAAPLLPGPRRPLAAPACADPDVEDEAPLEAAFGGDDKADTVGAARFAITAGSIEGLRGSLTSVRPAVRTANPGHAPELYLQPGSALGPAGPLGAFGPL